MMHLLLDTHVVIWALTDDPRLRPHVRDMLLNPENERYYSAAVLWEIAIKTPQRMGLKVSVETLARALRDAGYHEVPISAAHALGIARLPAIHSDPFDRIQYCQAIEMGALLLTADATLLRYGFPCTDARRDLPPGTTGR